MVRFHTSFIQVLVSILAGQCQFYLQLYECNDRQTSMLASIDQYGRQMIERTSQVDNI
jgi:hypothetical protein